MVCWWALLSHGVLTFTLSRSTCPDPAVVALQRNTPTVRPASPQLHYACSFPWLPPHQARVQAGSPHPRPPALAVRGQRSRSVPVGRPAGGPAAGWLPNVRSRCVGGADPAGQAAWQVLCAQQHPWQRRHGSLTTAGDAAQLDLTNQLHVGPDSLKRTAMHSNDVTASAHARNSCYWSESLLLLLPPSSASSSPPAASSWLLSSFSAAVPPAPSACCRCCACRKLHHMKAVTAAMVTAMPAICSAARAGGNLRLNLAAGCCHGHHGLASSFNAGGKPRRPTDSLSTLPDGLLALPAQPAHLNWRLHGAGPQDKAGEQDGGDQAQARHQRNSGCPQLPHSVLRRRVGRERRHKRLA